MHNLRYSNQYIYISMLPIIQIHNNYIGFYGARFFVSHLLAFFPKIALTRNKNRHWFII